MSNHQSTLWPLIGQELKLQLTQPSFIVFLVFAALFGSFVMQNQPISDGVEVWGPYYLASSVVKLGFTLPALIAFFTAKATLRDFQHNMVELTFSTPVPKFNWLASRWLGLFSATFLIYLSFISGMVAGLHFMDIEHIDYPLMAAGFIWPSMLLVLPAMLLAVSLIFAIGLFGRNALVIYISAGFAFIGYQTLLTLTGSPIMAKPILLSETLNQIFRLIDPVGSSAFYEQVKHWTIAQRNSQHIMLDTTLIINRSIIVIATLLTLSLTYWRFSFTLPVKKLKKAKAVIDTSTEHQYFPATISFAWCDRLNSLLSLCRQEYLLTIKTKSFALVSVFLCVVVGSEVIAGLSYLETMGVTPQPTTSVVINRFMHDVLPNFGSLFIAFFVAQVMWRDKEFNVSDLIETTPTTNSQFFIAKWLTLLMIPFTFIMLALVVSSMLQLLFGGTPDLLLNLSVFYYAGAPLVCLASLFLLIHSLVKSKVVGMVLSFAIAILAQSNLGSYIGIEHGMWRFSSTPVLQHSQLFGFDAKASAFNDYMYFWASLSLLFIMLGFGLFRRGLDIGLTQRIKVFATTNKQAKTRIALVSIVTLLAVVGSGSHLYYQVNIVGQYKNSDTLLQWRANYEQKYIKYKGLAQPTITDVTTSLAFYPNERGLAMSSTYQLTNQTNEAINQVLISTHHLFSYSNVVLSNASLLSFDKKHQQYLWQLEAPLLPQQSLSLSFDAKYQQNGHNGTINDNFISEEFTYFRDYRYMPFLGFVKHYQIRTPQLREEFGLAPLAEPLSLEQDIEKHQGDFSDDYMWATTDITISTINGQTAIAPGELVKQWVEGDRVYFQYTNDKPIRRLLTYFSFTHEKSTRLVDGINLEVYHRPQAKDLAKEHLNAMADTVSYANNHFSPYPAKQLRLVEMPNLLGYSGYASSQTILLDERFGFGVKRDNLDRSFDHLYRRTLHETAHQWWGYALDSAMTEGAAVLVETLAKLTEVLVLEQKYGKEYVRTLVQYEHNRYFNGRGISRVREKPLYRADENHLLYSKGSVAMNALVDKLGAKALTSAVSELINNHQYPKRPATSLDFIAVLKQQVAPNEHAFIDSWLKQVTLDDWQITKQSIEESKDGSLVANVCYINNRENVDEHGTRKAALANSRAQLVFFTKHPRQLFAKPKTSDTLATINISSDPQEQCIKQQLVQRPTHIAIDPYYLTLDNSRQNNLITLN